MNHQKPHYRFNGDYNNGQNRFNGDYNNVVQDRLVRKTQKIRIRVEHGKVAFRLLCPTALVGGVIGPYGTIVKNIELETTSKIMIEDLLTADCKERLVYIIGADNAGKMMSFRNMGDGETRDSFNVSFGQEALIRVYERIIELECGTLLESEGKGVMYCCRLLAVRAQIGALMGREGKNIDMIRNGSGACIRVLDADQVPPFADHDDELIQITGDSIAVRKALVVVSRCLQEFQPKEKASAVILAPNPSSSYGAYQSYPNNGSSFTPIAQNVARAPIYQSFRDRDSNPNMNGSTFVEIVYRMLCLSDITGSLIGKGGSIVRTVQDETGASIHFGIQVPGCNERVVTISAMEKLESHQSPAQNALFCVFAQATEILTKIGLLPKWNNVEGVNVKLLIPPKQVGCLIGKRGTIVSDMQRSTGAVIQILDEYRVPQCASNEDRVVLIAGGYANVRSALTDVTRRLRERILSSKGLLNSDFVPSKRVEECSTSNVNVSQGLNVLPHQHFASQRHATTSTGKSELVNSTTVGNATLEVPVPQNIFSSVFDASSNCLSKIIEISGAKIELQHPSDGNDGKVIISGTSDQAFAGQCLLHAYIGIAR